jgi:hypothetical protein
MSLEFIVISEKFQNFASACAGRRSRLTASTDRARRTLQSEAGAGS